MRIEISTGSIGISVNDFQTQYQTFLSNTESVVSSFKTIKKEVWNLNGGIGNLQNAMNDVANRISTEEHREDSALSVLRKTDDFLSLVNRVDRQLCDNIERNREELYAVHPWLRPEITEDEKQWYESAWDWLCDRSEVIGNGLKRAWDWTENKCVKMKDTLIEYYLEHKKVIDTLAIVISAIISCALAVGSVGLIAEILGLLHVPVIVAELISIAFVSYKCMTKLVLKTLEVVDIWWKIDDPELIAYKEYLEKSDHINSCIFMIKNFFKLFILDDTGQPRGEAV